MSDVKRRPTIDELEKILEKNDENTNIQINPDGSITATPKESPFFLTPIGRRIIIQPDVWAYKGRLVIPDSAQRKATTGTIIAMSEEHELLKIGDRILYDTFAGGELGFQRGPDKEEVHLRYLSFDEVIAKLNDDSAIK